MTGNQPDDSPPASPSPPSGAHHNMSTLRKVSGPTLSLPPSALNGSPSSSPALPTTISSNGNASPNTPWGPPVTIGATGKSGKFIERLQNENASLRREYNVERSAKEEAQKSLSTSKAIEDKFRAENARLEMLHTTNTRAIERKNRKIEELKISLEAEAARRQSAETREQQMATELDNTHTEKYQAVSEAHTRELREKANADALRDGMHRMQQRYERQIQKMSKDITALTEKQREDRKRILALEVSGEQSRSEIRNSDDIVNRMGSLLETYSTEHNNRVQQLESEAQAFRKAANEREIAGDRLIQEMQDTKDKMKWTMNIDQMQRGAPRHNTPSKPTNHSRSNGNVKAK